MFSETTFLLVFGLGAVCIMLGFFLVLRGIGGVDSESSIKLIGIEIRASRVGPGILFALVGLVLIVVALGKQPGPPQPEPKPTSGPVAPPKTADAPMTGGDEPTQLEPPAAKTDPTPQPVVGGDSTTGQRNREAQLIRQFLGEAARGICNPAILGPAPLADCQRSIQMMQPQLMAAGPVQDVNYMASAQTQMGVADRFVVRHSATMATWTGVLGEDGRFATLVTP